ncbi:MAG: hypothetical protein PHX08_01020 [Lachnospiraceae bacterium]|nr:hypothetical protein [Lachnospiraceae bacterium]
MKKKIYKAIVAFEDLQDEEGTKYQIGDTFPKKGTVAKARITELSTEKNRLKTPVIEEVEEEAGEEETTEKPAEEIKE